MRILHIIDTLSMGGAENMLIGLTSGQISHGHEVTIMPLVCPGYTPVRAKIEESGVVVKPAKSKGSVYNPFIIPKIAKELKYFDIIHVHLFPAFYWVFFAKLLVYSPAPMIYTEHSTNNKRRNKALWHMMDKWVYQRGYKKIVACAEKVLDTFTIAFPSIKHTCYINNGVNIKAFSEASSYSKRELLGVDENTFVVTMVARFMTMKRQDTIVEALPRLSDNIHAVFVGGEEGNSGLIAVKDLAIRKGVSNRVHFLFIRNDVPRILKSSDVVVMASDYEGLSLSSIEGMAAGKPFVASNVNGLREVVGGAGVLFENKDSDALAGIINHLYEDKEFYRQIADKCLIRSLEYDSDRMVTSYLKVYNDIINPQI